VPLHAFVPGRANLRFWLPGVMAVAAVPVVVRSEYVLHVAVAAGIYVILASSLNVTNGYAGLFSFGHAAFFGSAAYITGLSLKHLTSDILPAMVISFGCLIVIDDFGAGYSNFDRIWRLKPDIVKIDREMTRRVAVEPLARRMFNGIISLLHEAGAIVCVEGIETQSEALCAVDANADLMQGNYFNPGGDSLQPADARRNLFGELIAEYRTDVAELQKRQQARLEPYLAALKNAVQDLSLGTEFPQAVQVILKLPCARRCYLIGSDGLQIGANIESDRNVGDYDPRFDLVQPTEGTDWQTKSYFRRAIESPAKVQITRPYLSVSGPKLCMTLSFAFEAFDDRSQQVLCADLDFATLAGGDVVFGAGNLQG